MFVAVAIPLCEVLPASLKRQGGKPTPLLFVNAIFAMMADSKSRNAKSIAVACLLYFLLVQVSVGGCWSFGAGPSLDSGYDDSGENLNAPN